MHVLIGLLTALALASGETPPAARLDGELQEMEWRGARREPLTGGGEVLLRVAGEWLYVGVRGEGRGIASLCLAGEDRIDILHASAALGNATYRRAQGGWTLAEGFNWQVRDSATGPASAAEAESFLAARGWLASANRLGSPNWEFRIRRPPGGWRLGVNFLGVEPLNLAHWPAAMSDDCTAVRLAQGDPPATARFVPESWARID